MSIHNSFFLYRPPGAPPNWENNKQYFPEVSNAIDDTDRQVRIREGFKKMIFINLGSDPENIVIIGIQVKIQFNLDI